MCRDVLSADLEKKKIQEPLPNLSWTLRCQNRYRQANASPSGHQHLHKPAKTRLPSESTFYEEFVSRRRFLLQSSSSRVPNRPSVFRISLSFGLKQPITALNPCREPLPCSVDDAAAAPKDKIMPSRASALRLCGFQNLASFLPLLNASPLFLY